MLKGWVKRGIRNQTFPLVRVVIRFVLTISVCNKSQLVNMNQPSGPFLSFAFFQRNYQEKFTADRWKEGRSDNLHICARLL